MSLVRFRPEAPIAGIAHLVERHLAKVEVASSSLVARSKLFKSDVKNEWCKNEKTPSSLYIKRMMKPSFVESNGAIAKW